MDINNIYNNFFNHISEELHLISSKVLNDERISFEEGIVLYEKADLSFLGTLANFIRTKKHGKNTYYKKNFHLEPTNICVYNCKFCSYSRKQDEEGSWNLSTQEIVKILYHYKSKNVSEIHITGGVNPSVTFDDYCNLLKLVRETLPSIHIKAYSAIELDYIFQKSNISYKEGLIRLKDSGLNSIPGGGAEIFDESIRKQICPEKASSVNWLNIHETAHKLGIKTNATMLYGHIENYSHRIDHLDRLRKLQEKTNGFDTFIPLKYRKENNSLSHINELPIIEDLKNYAVSRIYLDNIPHIKAYWPMIGKDITQLSLSFGVNDIDGTIDDSTKIYTMAGVNNDSNKMTEKHLKTLINKTGYKSAEKQLA